MCLEGCHLLLSGVSVCAGQELAEVVVTWKFQDFNAIAVAGTTLVVVAVVVAVEQQRQAQ